MNKRFSVCCLLTVLLILPIANASEQVGGIRGMVYDDDFDAPLAAAAISIAETGDKTVSTDAGNYVFGEVKPGTYTLLFSKEGYVTQVKANVVVAPGQMAELDASLAGDFTEMEEFVVQDVQIGTGTEAALLDLRLESPALMDSIGSELMSRAGASDAAQALRLVSGTTVQDGKYATVRGLPDRYVNSQMNSVRLPTADADKRAVQLDQFPAAVIESVQVSKTFTPDQQGDASGGAVNVVLKGIPEKTTVSASGQYSWNTQVQKAGSDFLSYKGGGVDTWGKDDGSRDPQQDNTDWNGAVGVNESDAPTDHKWSVAGGGKKDFEDFRIGAFGSFFYEKDSSHYDGGINDRYWVEPGKSTMTPQYRGQMFPGEISHTSLFDVTQSSQRVQWGGLGVLGFETENHSLSLLYMYTRDAEDKVTLAENTRGKASLHKYWPETFGPEFDNYDPYDSTHPANQPYDPSTWEGDNYRGMSPYRRNETLEYTERTTQTLQFNGKHTLPDLDFISVDSIFGFLAPELDWTVADSSATLYQPDKRLYSTLWGPPNLFIPTGTHGQYIPAESVASLGNLQRIWKDISEESSQYFANLKLPFEQWSGDEGYLKFGIFNDDVTRDYDQDSFSNIGEEGAAAYYFNYWENRWSDAFPDQTHIMEPSNVDVDYSGEQNISATYWMTDLPFNSYFKMIGGYRYEKTDLTIVNDPEGDVNWYPPNGGGGPVQLEPGQADVTMLQNDVLPSIGFEFKPWEKISLRGNYSETVARPTFKELTPIEQVEYVGGDIFIGNKDLKMSSLKNYDLRLDWTPYESALVSASYFHKDVKDPIEVVQERNWYFDYTTASNYPEGMLDGFEFEVRQQLGRFFEDLDGISVGGNATIIESEVTLPADDAKDLADRGYPEPTRNMSNAPEHLYNFFVTYELEKTGTELALFYTIRGDTLTAGAGEDGVNYIPSVYETEYGTLNFSLSQKLGEIWTLKFQAKNLLDPEIETVYRSKYIGSDVTKTSYTKGIDFSIALSASF